MVGFLAMSCREVIITMVDVLVIKQDSALKSLYNIIPEFFVGVSLE